MAESASLLLVEDELNVGRTLEERLSQEGFTVRWVQTFSAGVSSIEAKGAAFDLALLDVGLPDGSGFDLAEKVRFLSPRTAIVFVTAFGRPEDRVQGLELGAEDYVVKPFNFRELLLRVQNALKRARALEGRGGSAKAPVLIGRATVDFAGFKAVVGGKTRPLTHKECALLKMLHERKGEVVSREDILDSVWTSDEFPTTRTVDNFILRLRKLVEKDPAAPRVIRSVRGIGYQLNDEEGEGT